VSFLSKLSHGAGADFLSLLSALVAFGIGFTRAPSRLRDRAHGRSDRAPLCDAAVVHPDGVGLLGVVLTPSYASIGVAAPILLVFFRLVQGFALGGEVGPTTAFLIEASPPDRRGFVGSWQSGSQGIASLVGAVIAFSLSKILTGPEITEFGWRIAFGAGA